MDHGMALTEVDTEFATYSIKSNHIRAINPPLQVQLWIPEIKKIYELLSHVRLSSDR